jgi:glutamate formiminotransferase
MAEIVWCVPNFSEGRDQSVIDQITAEVEAVKDVKFLGADPDPDHHRVVVSFVGTRAGVAEAAFQAVAKGKELIDLNHHEGEHPRMGATDVVPFVPVQGVTMDDCIEVANQVGKRIGEELDIPVYLYEKAATRPGRVNLATVRKGQFEGLRDLIGKDPDRAPDFGPDHIHPTAGATAVGARMPLIAYNVNLGTEDVKVVKAVAKAVRHISGGFRHVKAMGFEIKDRGITQVSMNLVNYKASPIYRVQEAIRREAARYGVPVVGAEVVGLLPQEAMVEVAKWYLQLEDFSAEQILENRIWE